MVILELRGIGQMYDKRHRRTDPGAVSQAINVVAQKRRTVEGDSASLVDQLEATR